MSPIVRPAEIEDTAGVAALLHTHMNARIPPDRWARLLDYPWRPEDAGAGRGWLVEDAGRIVGYMGTVTSDRPLAGGGGARFCDLSSWYLMADYRGDGTGDRLLRAGMADPAIHYATMTARRATGRKIRALGFSVLDATQSLFRRGEGVGRPLGVIRDEGDLLPRLNDRDRAIHEAHRGYDLHHALLDDGHAACYLVWQRKLKGAAIAFHDCLHASDWRFVSRHASAIADAILDGDPAVLAVDSRFMAPGDDPGEVRRLPLERWYRSPHLGPAEFGHLYSEVVLLDQKLP